MVEEALEELREGPVCREGRGGSDEVGQDAVATSLLCRVEVGFGLLQVRNVPGRAGPLGAQRLLSSARSFFVQRQMVAPQVDGVSGSEGTVRPEALAIHAGAIPAAQVSQDVAFGRSQDLRVAPG